MKKLFTTLAFVLLVTPALSFAQTTTTQTDPTKQCDRIYSFNYNSCCSGADASTNQTNCNAYLHGYASTQSSTPQPTGTQTTSTQTDPTKQCDRIYSFNYSYCCGTFRSQNKVQCDAHDGTGGYTPGQLNSSSSNPSTQTINGAATQQDVIFDTPQAGAAELKQCSAIKFKSLLDILIWVKCIILVAIIPIIFALALMFFLWGVMKFIRASDSVKREEGRKFIIAGLIGLFVMTSLWGIISIVSKTLGTGSAVPLLQTTYLKQ